MASGQNVLLAGLGGRLGSIIVYQSGGQTVLRSRTPRQRGYGTPTQQKQRTIFQTVAGAWRSLDTAQKADWSRLAARLPDWDGTRHGLPLSGYQCWLTVGTGRAALGLPLLTDAPAVPDLPPFLPRPTLAPALRDGELTLTLSCGPAPFHAPIQVMASRPHLPGETAVRDKDLVQIALLPGLPAGGADIGPEYTSKFPAWPPGLSVMVKAVPLSATGFRGQAVSASGIMAP